MNNSSDDVDSLKKRLNDQILALDTSAIVAITDARGIIVYANSKFCELSEYSQEDLLGSSHVIVNSGFHDKDFFIGMWKTISQGKVWRGEVCNRAKSGKIYWVDTTIVPFVNSKQKVEQYIAIRYDITEKKQTELELEEERKRLVESEKMASIGVLSSGIAHELGNPLGAIRGRLEMLETLCSQEDMDKTFALKSIEKMIRDVDRMTKIIRGLKSYSRDGSKDEKQDFDLSQLIGDILEVSMEKCQKNGIKVTKVGFDAPIIMRGRETEIGQVIVNIFNNAIDAVKNSENARIELEVDQKNGKLEIYFKDSGPGVPDDIVGKIFDPFFTTKDVGQGTGLGLSICRSIINEHQGELSYEKDVGHSCFKVTLPWPPHSH